MMTLSSFQLLDANVVIYLFKCGAWTKLVQRVKLRIARTVMSEAHFYETDSGERVDFDLGEFERSGAIEVIDVALPQLQAFVSQFDASYVEKLDPGEAESLAYLLAASDDTRICSADGIVFRVLGNLDRGEQGMSLEELLHNAGLARKVPSQFSQKFRATYHAKGVEERLQGRGAKPIAQDRKR